MDTTQQPANPTTATQQLFRLIYRSHSRLLTSTRGQSLGEIFTVARSNNRRDAITGALLITDHYFVQALEGEESRVRSLFSRIAQDPRHEDVTVVEGQVIEARVFDRWAMAEVSKSGQADIPLQAGATEGGLTSAASRPLTGEQLGVLHVMRATVGADTV